MGKRTKQKKWLFQGVDLDKMRETTDPLADSVVEEILKGDEESDKVIRDMFRSLVENRDIPSEDMPAAALQYLDATDELPPEWNDVTKLAHGEALFNLHGPDIIMMLFCMSLPLAYSCGNGAKVLIKTGRLDKDTGTESLEGVNRRLLETAQFIMDVMQPNGLTSKKGRGIVSIQKVRLMHASIRYFIWEKARTEPESWHPMWGQPINQEDLAGTLMSFSITPIEGMEKLGIPISETEKEAYIYAWNAVGALLGINPRLLPKSVDAARKLKSMILERQSRETKQGKQLTKSLIDYMAWQLPGDVFDEVPAYMIRYLLGEEMAHRLGIRDEGGHSVVGKISTIAFKVIGVANEILGESSLVQKMYPQITNQLMRSMIHLWNEKKEVHFDIPPSLQRSWRL